MDIEIKHEKKYQQFTVYLENNEEAELAYATPSDKVLDFTHSYVPESARGKGIIQKLIKAGMQYAEENNLQVVASCPAVASYLQKHTKYQHLLK